MTDRQRVVNITHKNCFDGVTAAWVVRKWAMEHGYSYSAFFADYFDDLDSLLPEGLFKDAIVVFTDFSVKPDYLLKICEQAAQVAVYDHHETAEKNFSVIRPEKTKCPLWMKFDPNRSGAGIAWDEFFPHVPRPAIVDVAEDHDLWRFNYPDTKAVMAYFGCLGVEIDSVEKIHRDLTNAITMGEILLAKDAQMVDWHLDKVDFINMNFIRNGLKIPVVNAPRYIANKVADRLTDDYPIVFMYEDYADLRKCSVRSNGKWGLNCAEIAGVFGGGGNPKTAGFTCSKDTAFITAVLAYPGFITKVSKFKKEEAQ